MPSILDILKHRYTFVGLILSYMIVIIVLEAVLRSLSLKPYCLWHVFLWVILGVTVLFFWIWNRKYLPKNNKCKFSVVAAIITESEKQRSRLLSDFRDQIEEQLTRSSLGNKISLIILNQHQSKAINDFIKKVSCSNNSSNKEEKYLTRLMVRKKYNLIIYGCIKERLDEENLFVIDTRVVLLGKAVGEAYEKQVSKVMKNVWIPSIRFPERFELKGTSAVANYFFLSSLYLVGYAAYFSGLTSDSIELFEKLLLQNNNTGCRIILSLDSNWFTKLKTFISHAYILLARAAYNKDPANKVSVVYVDRSLALKESYDALLFKAVLSFEHGRNITESISYIQRAQASATSNVWKYSMAFLLFYTDKHEEALRYYNSIAKSSYPEESVIIHDVIRFIIRVLRDEPDKHSLYFALGFLYYKKLANYENGIRSLEMYLTAPRKISEGVLSSRARIYLTEMKRFIGSS